ncbi:unnamed protein product [Closterium sp. NIES-64]|nr:unnamed protein product [Closterium sp. NIES-64]
MTRSAIWLTAEAQLNVLELFLDCLTEENARLVQFGMGGLCNATADAANLSAIDCHCRQRLVCACLPLLHLHSSHPISNSDIQPA